MEAEIAKAWVGVRLGTTRAAERLRFEDVTEAAMKKSILFATVLITLSATGAAQAQEDFLNSAHITGATDI